MRDLIPIRQPSNTWRGFAIRVLIIALAASVVLGIAALFGITLDPLHTGPQPLPHEAPHSTGTSSTPEP